VLNLTIKFNAIYIGVCDVGKSSNDLVSLRSCEGIKEDAVAISDGFEILGEPVPQPSLVLVCVSRNCSLIGSFSSNEVNHELILLGSGTI
jgi:hypothetical protein